jgi:glycosyltransferase involved in cell wall biosynthesis
MMRPTEERRARASETPSAPFQPLLVCYGSIRDPRGGSQTRVRAVAEALTALGTPPRIVSTSERDLSPVPWATSMVAPRRKLRLELSLPLVRLIRRAGRGADAVIIPNALFLPALALSGVRAPLVWDTNECQTLHYRRMAPTLRNRLSYAVWFILESWGSRRCHVAIAISEAEKEVWVRTYPILRDKLVVVDHAPYVRTPDPTPAQLAHDGPLLLFVGTMVAKHNVAAAKWITDELAPKLPAPITIALAGPGTDRYGRSDVDGGGRVIGLGEVEDIDGLIAAADLCLAPLAAGAGVKTKVLHYLAHGRRVAGTPVAFEGIDDAPGLISAPLDELVAVVLELASTPETEADAAARASAQRGWLEEHHGPARIKAQLRQVVACL